MKKRKSPIAKSLVNNSITGMLSAIEIHNKPTIKYRYEMVVLLLVNAWELALKGYLYKYHKNVKLNRKDGTTKPFESCINIISQKIGKEFYPTHENLNVLYEYRNQVAHYYLEELDPIVFSLISKSIIFYSDFLRRYFNIDLSEQSDLILLPIGFKRPISPIDYISVKSSIEKSPPEIKTFLNKIFDASLRLNNAEIQETIFVDFRINLINTNRIINADIVAGIDNTKSNNLVFSVNKEPRKLTISNEGQKISLTRNREEAQGTLYYEELHEGIFDEINNILDANRLLAKGNRQFMLGAALYYRIYSERQHVSYNIDTFDLLARAGSVEFYSPFLFWLTNLPSAKIADIIFDIFQKAKSPNVYNLIRIVIILGDEVINKFKKLFEKKYTNIVQKPDFIYTFNSLAESRNTNPILKALKASSTKVLLDNFQYGQLLSDTNLPLNILSKECMNVFNGAISQRSLTRELDFLTYGRTLVNNEQLISEILKR